jgi:hypothetical protein
MYEVKYIEFGEAIDDGEVDVDDFLRRFFTSAPIECKNMSHLTSTISRASGYEIKSIYADEKEVA